MELIRFPTKDSWNNILKRPRFDVRKLERKVSTILDTVKKEGDEALKRYSKLFDKVDTDTFLVSDMEIQQALSVITPDLKRAIRLAADNIKKFHEAQFETATPIEINPGVTCWCKSIAIEKVGFYIPGGTAPLFSTVLMLAIPAKIAGCSEIILCTPPNRNGNIDPMILFSALEVGIDKIFKIGGAQAIAAMAYCTETVPRVYKIFGPGNQYVTSAKQLVSRDGVAIDMPAGPSEVAVLADNSADPEIVAADLLSQAEHGVDSQVLLITDDETLINDVQGAVNRQLEKLPRREIARQALLHSKLILLSNLDEGMDLINTYAPEHLILMVREHEKISSKVINAGSVFLGKFTPESAGDYASGTNHTLPTYGYARNYSGVSLSSFMKKITFQSISGEGLRYIGPAIDCMAEAEGMDAHKYAVSIRLKKLSEIESDD